MKRMYAALGGLWSIGVMSFILFFSSGGGAYAYPIPIQWSGNGHWYEVVRLWERKLPDMTWEAAGDYASGLTYDGSRGYLATITSAAENAFIWGLLDEDDSWIWLGGYQTPQSGDGPSDNWRWVTGEAWYYTNWACWGDGYYESNDLDESAWYSEDGDENYLMMFNEYDTDSDTEQLGTWNDTTNSSKSILVVEYGQPAHTPEPASLLLLGSGLIGLGYWLRKQKIKNGI